ncbi:MAG: ATP phosphoribosyltransferase [Clostridiaceae bacterium]|nr:ATP phosphoribosyltransferase [Clostridiaceae bacterium]
MITVALPKGRLLKEVIAYLESCDLKKYADKLDPKSRLLFTDVDGIRFVYAKGRDVPTYVESGIADLGFIGSDIITENKFELLNVSQLPFGYCRFSLCGLPGVKQFKSVATSFYNISFQYFKKKKQQVSFIHLHGSVELAPLLGLADGIVDIVQTGSTLKANGLIEYETIMDVQACLIANRQTFYTKEAEVYPFLKKLGVFE